MFKDVSGCEMPQGRIQGRKDAYINIYKDVGKDTRTYMHLPNNTRTLLLKQLSTTPYLSETWYRLVNILEFDTHEKTTVLSGNVPQGRNQNSNNHPS